MERCGSYLAGVLGGSKPENIVQRRVKATCHSSITKLSFSMFLYVRDIAFMIDSISVHTYDSSAVSGSQLRLWLPKIVQDKEIDSIVAEEALSCMPCPVLPCPASPSTARTAVYWSYGAAASTRTAP